MAGAANQETPLAVPPAQPDQGAETQAPGGVQRGSMDDDKTFDSFTQARHKVRDRADAQETAAAQTAAIKDKADTIADEKLKNFDLDNFIQEVNAAASQFESDLDLATKLQQIREEGLTEEQKQKLEEIKKKVAELTSTDTSGQQPPASGGATGQQPSAQPAQQPPAQQTPPPAQQTPPTQPPAQPPTDQPPAQPPVQGDMTEQITKAVSDQIEAFKSEFNSKVDNLTKENTELKQQVADGDSKLKEVIAQRDDLKEKNRQSKFGKAAGKAGIPSDAHDLAYTAAQNIVNSKEHNPDQKEMTYEDIFPVMQKVYPSLFGKKEASETQIKPGAQNTGTPQGGALQPKQQVQKKKPETFAEAKANLHERVSAEAGTTA